MMAKQKNWKLSEEQKDQIIALREQGRSYQSIAQQFGLSRSGVRYHCLKEGAWTPREIKRGVYNDKINVAKTFIGYDGKICRRFSDEEDARMTALRSSGMNITAIARKMDRPRTSVRVRLMTLARNDELAA